MKFLFFFWIATSTWALCEFFYRVLPTPLIAELGGLTGKIIYIVALGTGVTFVYVTALTYIFKHEIPGWPV